MGNRSIALSYLVWVVGATFGLAYLTMAICGWMVTGWHGQSELIIFTVNPLHNVIHAVIGLAVLAGAAVADQAVALALTVAGCLLGLVSALGFLGLLDATAGYGIADPANFLHLLTGAAALSTGLLYVPEENAPPQRARREEQDYGERVAIQTNTSQGALWLRVPPALPGMVASTTAQDRWSSPVRRSAPSTSLFPSAPLRTPAGPPAPKS